MVYRNVYGGGNNKHELVRPISWFLNHVIFNILSFIFYILQVLLSTMIQAKSGNTKALPLPYLMTRIFSKKKCIQI